MNQQHPLHQSPSQSCSLSFSFSVSPERRLPQHPGLACDLPTVDRAVGGDHLAVVDGSLAPAEGLALAPSQGTGPADPGASLQCMRARRHFSSSRSFICPRQCIFLSKRLRESRLLGASSHQGEFHATSSVRRVRLVPLLVREHKCAGHFSESVIINPRPNP